MAKISARNSHQLARYRLDSEDTEATRFTEYLIRSDGKVLTRGGFKSKSPQYAYESHTRSWAWSVHGTLTPANGRTLTDNGFIDKLLDRGFVKV